MNEGADVIKRALSQMSVDSEKQAIEDLRLYSRSRFLDEGVKGHATEAPYQVQGAGGIGCAGIDDDLLFQIDEIISRMVSKDRLIKEFLRWHFREGFSVDKMKPLDNSLTPHKSRKYRGMLINAVSVGIYGVTVG